MIFYRYKKLSLLFLALSLNACTSSNKTSTPGFIPITILHTNDIHGHAWPLLRKGDSLRGGYAAQLSLVKKIRQELEDKGGITLLLSAGDVNTGVPESDLLDAEPDFKAMNALEYDAMVLGNHEFDGGIPKVLKQMRLANFPMLSANVTYSDGTASIFSPAFIVLEKKGLRFGILGLTTDTLRDLVIPERVKRVNIKNVISTTQEKLPELQALKPDILLALTHMGISQSGKRPNRIVVNDDRRLAEENFGFSVIVGGHSHTLLPEGERVNRSLIVQAGEKGEYLGRVDLLWDSQKRTIAETKASVIPIDVQKGEDENLKILLNNYRTHISKELDAPIGNSLVELDGEREQVRSRETNLGNLVCDAIRESTKTDIAVFNGGGIRASLPKGIIKKRDILVSFPFKNSITTTEITGKQLKQLLQLGLERQGFTGTFLQVSGLKYVVKNQKLRSVEIAGKKVSDSSRFSLATNSFVSSTTDFQAVFSLTKNLKDTGILVDDSVSSFIKANHPLNPPTEKRIILVP